MQNTFEQFSAFSMLIRTAIAVSRSYEMKVLSQSIKN